MKRLILVLFLFADMVHVNAVAKDSLLVMFWNVENFFDWMDQGTGESDAEFSSYGDKHWTRSKFYAKCDAIAKAFMWAGDKYGRMPDVIGLAEVENRGVLTRMLSSTLLRKFDYVIVHRDSDDRRGIDVALLYRRSSMNLISSSFVTSDGLRTRDILHAELSDSDGIRMDFIVNHHPSKYGGAEESAQRRKQVMNSLKTLCDSLVARGGNRIIAMGDFNDTPDAEQFSLLEGLLENKGLPLHQDGKGSIRYKGRWELIDFFLTRGIENAGMEILEIPFLMTYDRSYPGYKPLRTFSGPRYLGGVSDHCPILFWIE